MLRKVINQYKYSCIKTEHMIYKCKSKFEKIHYRSYFKNKINNKIKIWI